MDYQRAALLDAGYFYCPYISLTSAPVIEAEPIYRPILDPGAVDAAMSTDWAKSDEPRDLDFDWSEEGF